MSGHKVKLFHGNKVRKSLFGYCTLLTFAELKFNYTVQLTLQSPGTTTTGHVILEREDWTLLDVRSPNKVILVAPIIIPRPSGTTVIITIGTVITTYRMNCESFPRLENPHLTVHKHCSWSWRRGGTQRRRKPRISVTTSDHVCNRSCRYNIWWGCSFN